MIKTKIFLQGFGKPGIDYQINKWLAKHPNNIIVDVKLQSHLLKNDEYSSYIVRDALVIYQKYEK